MTRWLKIAAVAAGALVVLLGYLIARRVTTPGIAIFVAVVLAFDPFVLRNDTRVMLETPTTAAMLAGWLVLLAPRPRPIAAGLLKQWQSQENTTSISPIVKSAAIDLMR